MSVVTDQPVDDSRVSRRRDLAAVLSGPRLPTARGPLSATVLSALRQRPGFLGRTPPLAGVDGLADDDLQLALYCCYELHYRGFRRADADWEWDPGLLTFRAELERAFLQRLRDEIGPAERDRRADVGDALVELVGGASGPSLSTFLLESGTLDQLREFCVHRSAYQLKEADPHTFAIPRLSGDAKAAMVEIQHDEYGSGRAVDMHSVLFVETMTALGLDPVYGAYLDRLPGTTLATVNLASMLGLHRHWRAALVGHLAVFEMTSVEPMSRYSAALARMDIGPEGRRFYDVHVAADARHGRVALERMVAGFIETEPHLGADLLFGAAADLLVEERFSRDLLSAWSTGRSSLLPRAPMDRAGISPRSDTQREFGAIGCRGLRATSRTSCIGVRAGGIGLVPASRDLPPEEYVVSVSPRRGTLSKNVALAPGNATSDRTTLFVEVGVNDVHQRRTARCHSGRRRHLCDDATGQQGLGQLLIGCRPCER